MKKKQIYTFRVDTQLEGYLSIEASNKEEAQKIIDEIKYTDDVVWKNVDEKFTLIS